MSRPNHQLDLFTRLLHFGLMVFGISAWLTGELAEIEAGESITGYTIHAWLGLAMSLFFFLRLVYGFIGPRKIRFSQWYPLSRAHLAQSWDELMLLLRFKLPPPHHHQGLAGLVQFFGLLIFGAMALTGTVIYFIGGPGVEQGRLLYLFTEAHEYGEGLIPLFLAMHVGAVLIHALSGKHIWRQMFFLK